jgi:colanic acid biosynthesis glycosyl transferase WcaI
VRILLLTHHYAPEVGPPQLRWGSLVRDFRAEGHEVHVIAPPPHYPFGQLLPGQDAGQVGTVQTGEHGETVHRVAWRPSGGRAVSSLLDQLLSAGHGTVTAWRRRRMIAPDVVVATVPALPTMAAGWLTSKLLHVPFVLEMRDAWPDLASDARNPGRSVKQLIRWYAVAGASRGATFLQRRADLVVTTTEGFADVLRRRGIRHVATVRNAFHEVPGVLVHEGVPARERTVDDPLHIVYVGTVGRAQGLETAARALAKVRAAGVDARLRVVGTGTRLGLLRSAVSDLQVPVEVVGPQPREAIHAHYRWADTLLVSLRDWRGLLWAVPSKLYEALALGLHVSGVAAGETRQIVEETGAGFAVDPGDEDALAQQWIELARSGPRPDRERMRAWVAEHASERGTSAAYLRLLDRLLSRSRERAR